MVKRPPIWLTSLCALICLCAAGCQNRASNKWEGTQSSCEDPAQAPLQASLWGSEAEAVPPNLVLQGEEEFIALEEEDLKAQFADGAVPISNRIPGEVGSGIPSIEKFYKPTAYLASLFRNVHFNTDEYVLRSKESLVILEKVADYLKSHKEMIVCIQGHCDERGPEAYNLALGTRRSNYVRSALVKQGVSPDQIHTVSYGKERPIDFGHNQRAWAVNRRAEFTLFELK